MPNRPDIPHVKICGITSLEEAKMAVRNKADAIGLLMLDAKYDQISVELARHISEEVGDKVTPIMVTHEVRPEAIKHALNSAPHIRTVQLHNEHLTPQMVDNIREAIGGNYSILIAISTSKDDPLEKLQSQIQDFTQCDIDGFVVDTRYTPENNFARESHNWANTALLTNETDKPILLAGGLAPDSVSRAIQQGQPYGVDVHTGVENTDGSKSDFKMKHFIQNAHKQLASHQPSL